jgi:hypothetical protein
MHDRNPEAQCSGSHTGSGVGAGSKLGRVAAGFQGGTAVEACRGAFIDPAGAGRYVHEFLLKSWFEHLRRFPARSCCNVSSQCTRCDRPPQSLSRRRTAIFASQSRDQNDLPIDAAAFRQCLCLAGVAQTEFARYGYYECPATDPFGQFTEE